VSPVNASERRPRTGSYQGAPAFRERLHGSVAVSVPRELGGGLAQQRRGGRVGVGAQPHLLHVDDHRVERAQHVGARSAGRTVEAVDRQPGAPVAAVLHRRGVVLEAAPAVLGGKQRHQLDPGRGAQRLERRDAGGGERGLVGEQHHPPTVQEAVGIGEQRVDAEAHGAALRVGHPLTAPAVRPAMNCRDISR
jgi:hypothetical protein